MQQFDRPVTLGVYAQPVTDITGGLLASLTNAVASYNWLVLLSFPLTAGAAHLLARHLALSPVASAFVGLAYAFAPFHVAHAAYHPHVAQTQWLPLYFLALFRTLDRGTAAAAALLGAATLTVVLSNFYGGLIAAVLTPVAVFAYCMTVPRTAGWRRGFAVTAAMLGLVGRRRRVWLVGGERRRSQSRGIRRAAGRSLAPQRALVELPGAAGGSSCRASLVASPSHDLGLPL